MSRHKWAEQARGKKCQKCGTKVVFKMRPSKKIKGEKVAVAWFQVKGGKLTEGNPPACRG